LDVFYVKIKADGFGNLLNVGAPINTYADDFAFGIDQSTHRGFISSNRSEKEGIFVYDNIYTFLETTPIIDLYFAQMEGYVSDNQTELPIDGATTVLVHSNNKIYKQVQTTRERFHTVETDKFETYFVNVSKETYDSDEYL